EAPAVLLVTQPQDTVVWARNGGPDAAVATVRKRSGGAYHPRMAERFGEEAPTILAGLDQEPTWESVLALEPGGRDCLTDEEFDRSCAALADFADLKSPYTLGHSPGVAALAAGAGQRHGLVEADVTAPRRSPARPRARRRLRRDLGESGAAHRARVGAGAPASLLYRADSRPTGRARASGPPRVAAPRAPRWVRQESARYRRDAGAPAP